MKKTKIIATYGPAIATPTRLSQIAAAGVNLFRVNCSYGSTADFVKAADLIRKSTVKSKYPVGLLLDIAGPKLRVDRFDGKLAIKTGQKLTLTAGRTNLKAKTIAVNHSEIIQSIKTGHNVYIDDGNLMFEAVSSGRGGVGLKALNSGTIFPGKGINLPQSNVKIPTIGDKDREDIKTAIRVKADYIAISFVRSPGDIREVRRIVDSFGGDQRIIAKLEKREAIANLDQIMQLSDGVMIARGDLGVEISFAELPKLQKRLIDLANRQHKPVIVATQMLESMRFAPRATRAEVNDVASAVFDAVDAVMLSAETATGKYPLETVKAMEQIIVATEEGFDRPMPEIEHHRLPSDIPLAIARSVSGCHSDKLARTIFAFTTSGFTAALISNLFPVQPVIALTPNTRVMTRLSLLRSVYPVLIEQPKSFEDMLTIVNNVCYKYRLANARDRVIITGGAPFGSTVPTNFMMLHEIEKRPKHVRRKK